VVFAYRLSRLTGIFAAWGFLIAALALTSFEDFAFFSSVIFVSYKNVETTVESYNIGSFLFVVLILVAIPGLFFVSMYKLHGLFKSLNQNAPERRRPREISPMQEA
jgi:hypothetical protein